MDYGDEKRVTSDENESISMQYLELLLFLVTRYLSLVTGILLVSKHLHELVFRRLHQR
jgi:hypothetical protein